MAHRLSDYYGRMVFATRELPLTATAAAAAMPTSSPEVVDLLWRYSSGERLLNMEPPDADAASAELAPLLDTFPQHPDVLALLGRADLARRNPGAALQRFEEAFRIFPRHEYAILVARAEIAAGDHTAARALLEPLTTRGKTEDVRQQARSLLRTIPSAANAADTTQNHTVMPVFRQKKPGEQQESGTLTEIACSAQWVILHVRLRDRELRVASTRLDLIDFISYDRTSSPPPLTCGIRISPESIRITWRAESTAPPGSDGIVEAVEFLPAITP
jgi:hypothetical protein